MQPNSASLSSTWNTDFSPSHRYTGTTYFQHKMQNEKWGEKQETEGKHHHWKQGHEKAPRTPRPDWAVQIHSHPSSSSWGVNAPLIFHPFLLLFTKEKGNRCVRYSSSSCQRQTSHSSHRCRANVQQHTLGLGLSDWRPTQVCHRGPNFSARLNTHHAWLLIRASPGRDQPPPADLSVKHL